MNILRKFSVRPKVDGDNHRNSMVYPVLYVIINDCDVDLYTIRGDDGTPVFLISTDITVEDVEL